MQRLPKNLAILAVAITAIFLLSGTGWAQGGDWHQYGGDSQGQGENQFQGRPDERHNPDWSRNDNDRNRHGMTFYGGTGHTAKTFLPDRRVTFYYYDPVVYYPTTSWWSSSWYSTSWYSTSSHWVTTYPYYTSFYHGPHGRDWLGGI